MAESFSKKEREKKRRKRKKEKAERKAQKKLEGTMPETFMYVDEDGHLTPIPPEEQIKKKEIKLEDIRVSTPKNSELEEIDNNRTGVVKFYNEEKRFGFIKESLTGEDFFVHEENLLEKIQEKDKVEFEIGNGPKGLVAINVRLAKKATKEK